MDCLVVIGMAIALINGASAIEVLWLVATAVLLILSLVPLKGIEVFLERRASVKRTLEILKSMGLPWTYGHANIDSSTIGYMGIEISREEIAKRFSHVGSHMENGRQIIVLEDRKSHRHYRLVNTFEDLWLTM